MLVFYTDHYDHYISDSEILTKYKGTSDANLLCNVPFFIYSADCAPMTVEKYVATYDILPTVVNLFGFDVDGRYYLGNDAFAENGGYVIFSDRSWIDSEEYYNVYSSTPTEKSKARSEEIAARLNACWNSIKIDYFKDK